MSPNYSKLWLSVAFLFLSLSANAQGNVSGFNPQQFKKYWRIESEAPNYKVSFSRDTAEIVSPKGLTMWRKEKMSGMVTIEYDACVVDEGKECDRLSDLNCFWMASDPGYPDNLWKRGQWRNGIFLNYYSLQLYYLGYGGNHNTTTRFRRYDGNEAAIDNADKRPVILQEYNDANHLLVANHWYHIKITNDDGRIQYFIDGERLVDFRDAHPLTSGWFGFRTTASRTRITNFHYSSSQPNAKAVTLGWIGDTPQCDQPTSFGVPFAKGLHNAGERFALKDASGKTVPADTWPLASWPDGSVKWLGVAAVVPAASDSLSLQPATGNTAFEKISISKTDSALCVQTGKVTAYIPAKGINLIDSLIVSNIKVANDIHLVCSTQSSPVLELTPHVDFSTFQSKVKNVSIESQGSVRVVVKIEGTHVSNEGREWLPFVVRLYFYAGSDQIKMLHSFVFDGDAQTDFIHSLGVRFGVPMREALYNRHVAFTTTDGGVWGEPVQPLSGRRELKHPDIDNLQQLQMRGGRIPDYESFDAQNRVLLNDWASWNSFRQLQLSADAFSVRKRANDNNPWIGTYSGSRAGGYAFAGDVSGGLGLYLKDFWQSYPSSFEIDDARTECARLTVWLWSPEAEPMDLRHYNNVAHGLMSSYEDVQEGMSTPFGIARTSELTIIPQTSYCGKESIASLVHELSLPRQMVCTPQYLHRQRAFGVWSLPDSSTNVRAKVELCLSDMLGFYVNAIEQNRWYGFWNYGDVMHAYDPARHEWKYDVGGFAWDNTELASNMWLWYSFLRTGNANAWRIAEAMTRHTSEVDVYHTGPYAALGSRHNVSHWGCGAKEARISQAAWNRFYYYLTADDRCGDLMHEVKDAEQKLYTIDPMRLAEPRQKYSCSAPARLRIGPDWLAYAGNWMTEWERTGNIAYRDKILAGMKSIAALRHGIFTGNKALGFDPSTGILTYEGDTAVQNTNHLLTIMGGFEVMNELMTMIDMPIWNSTWLNFALNYKQKAQTISHNHFRISRLQAYAAWQLYRPDLAKSAWNDMLLKKGMPIENLFPVQQLLPPQVPAPLYENPHVSTNDVAQWSLDAIYMLEVCPPND